MGRNIRGILHELGDAFGFFAEQKIYLVSQAANDLNFTFVVDEDQADRLVDQLHALLIHPEPGDKVHRSHLGRAVPQARRRRCSGHAGGGRRSPPPSSGAGRAAMRPMSTTRPPWRPRRAICSALKSVDRVHYATKANWNPELLQTAACLRA